MADAKKAKPSDDTSENDAILLAVETSEPMILQEPDRFSQSPEDIPAETASILPPKSEKSKSNLLGVVLGAAILTGAGFGVAKYVFPNTGTADAVAALQAQLDTDATEVAALSAQVADLVARPVAAAPDATLVDRIAVLETALASRPDTAAIEARITALEDRLTAIEVASASGQGAPTAALVAMDREMKALRAEMDAQKGAGSALTADIEAASAAAQSRLETAEAAAQAAAKQAALSHIRAAFESGAPLGPALDGLKALGAEVPESLGSAAEAVPTLLFLQDSFAEPARLALDASIRADMGEGWSERLSAFLRSQSGARSLTPREGADPDAVLSRAEAALRGGDLKSTLAELAAMPPAGIDAMAAWVAAATQRMNAQQAITELSATLNGQ